MADRTAKVSSCFRCACALCVSILERHAYSPWRPAWHTEVSENLRARTNGRFDGGRVCQTRQRGVGSINEAFLAPPMFLSELSPAAACPSMTAGMRYRLRRISVTEAY